MGILAESDITEIIKKADAKALATYGLHGVNVVPVSVVTVLDESIHLYDFFMGKTVENLRHSPQIAFTAWSGLVGVQVKATATYHDSGVEFEEAVLSMKDKFPDRVLRGLIKLTPTVVYDVSAGLDTAGVVLAGGDESGEEGKG